MIYLEATRNKCSRCQGNLVAFFSNNTEIYFFNNFWLIKYQSYLHIETSQVFLLFLWLNLNSYMLANHGLSKMGVSVVIRYIFVKYIFCDKVFYTFSVQVTQELLEALEELNIVVRFSQDLASILSLKASSLDGELISFVFSYFPFSSQHGIRF